MHFSAQRCPSSPQFSRACRNISLALCRQPWRAGIKEDCQQRVEEGAEKTTSKHLQLVSASRSNRRWHQCEIVFVRLGRKKKILKKKKVSNLNPSSAQLDTTFNLPML